MSDISDGDDRPRPGSQSEQAGPQGAQLLLLGASFAGLELLYQMRRMGYWRRNPEHKVLVVDQHDHSAYVPLIHEELFDLQEQEQSVPFSQYLRADPAIRYVQAKVTGVDFQARRVTLEDGRTLQGEKLIVALGSRLCIPGGIDPQGRCLSLKWPKDQGPLQAQLKEIGEKDEILVVGGGLSGVELAGELAHRLPGPPRVSLIHAKGQLLPDLPPRASRLAQRALQRLGVRLHLERRVQKVNARDVELADAQGHREVLPAKLVCWAGGVSAPRLEWRDAMLTAQGWLRVDPYLRVWSDAGEPHPNCYAVGDIAAIAKSPQAEPAATMRRAIEAIWQGKSLARMLCASQLQPSLAHPIRLQWPHGVSVGPASLLCVGPLVLNLGVVGRCFRRWLGKMYLRRYALSRM